MPGYIDPEAVRGTQRESSVLLARLHLQAEMLRVFSLDSASVRVSTVADRGSEVPPTSTIGSQALGKGGEDHEAI